MSEDKPIDPGVLAALGASRGATQEEKKALAPYQIRKKKRDAERDRLRIDVDAWLKDEIIDHAERQDMSWSQFAAFLMAFGLYKWVSGDSEVHQLFTRAKTRVASLKWHFALVLEGLRELVRKAAE